MNRLLMAAAGAALVASPAIAQMDGGIVLTNPEFANGFSNRGQCVAALAHVRNSQRADATTRGTDYVDLSASEYNRASLTTTRCENIDGTFHVVFYVNGFPDM
ncbi:MAG TPA: hypothetical protein VFP53_07270 [Sphingomicrobium sp.]|nr:hypothetical protein [Sphingomicrobium sp.]